MYAKEEALSEIVLALKKYIGKSFHVTVDMLDAPPNPAMGDIAFPCFEFAKGEKRSPIEIATELAAKIGPGELFDRVQAAGPYVNFFYNKKALAERVLDEVHAKKVVYGASVIGHGTKIVVEGAQPNTHKEFHIGHLRNAVLPQAIVNILKRGGYEVIFANYIGDIGAHIAKSLWAMEKFHEGETPPEEDRLSWLGSIYTEATAYIEEHPEAKEEVAEMQRRLEGDDTEMIKKWKESREWCLKEFRAIFDELHLDIDHWYFESEVEKPGKEIVQKMLTDGIAKKSEGAIIVDLEEEDLGVFLILKSDGSSLYSTKDLALAYQKEKDFSPDRHIIIVDVRQSLHFKQLFATLKRMGMTALMMHFPYDFVTLPEGAMSSRSGNIVSYTSLRDELIARLEKETAERHDDWDEKQIHEIAHKLAIASMQFMMLRQDPKSVITFDIEEAASFDGFTAPYILYTIARLYSLIRKVKKVIKPKNLILDDELEQELIRQIANYPFVLQNIAKDLNVAALAHWAFDTAKIFSEYYHKVRILDAESEEMVKSRLWLVNGVRIVLEDAMKLLAIETLEEM